MNLKEFAFSTMQEQFSEKSFYNSEISPNIDDGAHAAEMEYEERYIRCEFDGLYY